MKETFKDIFEYHEHINQQLIDQLIENESILSERTIALISHSINAHQIWNARITDQPKLQVHQIHSLLDCKLIDTDNYHQTLHILGSRDLDEQISYANSKGATFQNTIAHILFHISNHFSHHRGQIISELRQKGVAPITTDYIFYKR